MNIPPRHLSWLISRLPGLVTDRTLSRGRSSEEIVGAAVRGGVTCVQLREKYCSTREFVREARSLQPLLRYHQIPLIINDRLDVALAIGADGVAVVSAIVAADCPETAASELTNLLLPEAS